MADKVEEQASVEAPPIPRTLSQKIMDIQNSVGVVNKKGKFGTEMGSANYLRIEDAVVAVNKLISANKLIFTGAVLESGQVPHEKGSKDGNVRSGYIATVKMQWQLEDTETGEVRSWIFTGTGYDSTDKAIYKAMTGCRKYAIITIFNLPVGNDVEEHGAATFEEGKKAAKQVAATKIAQFAAQGNKTAIEAMSQEVPDKKVLIKRPEDMNGHYISVEGLIAVPQLERFFEDTGCKRFKRKTDMVPYWRVPADYEKGLIELCHRLEIEVEG